MKEMAIHSSVLAWRIPMDRGMWGATVCRVAKNRTQLKWLNMLWWIRLGCPFTIYNEKEMPLLWTTQILFAFYIPGEHEIRTKEWGLGGWLEQQQVKTGLVLWYSLTETSGLSLVVSLHLLLGWQAAPLMETFLWYARPLNCVSLGLLRGTVLLL